VIVDDESQEGAVHASNIADADASMARTVEGRIAHNIGIGLGSWRRCAIAIRQWLRAAHNCNKSADDTQERQYAGMNPNKNAGHRSEKNQEGGDKPQELVHAVFRNAIILDGLQFIGHLSRPNGSRKNAPRSKIWQSGNGHSSMRNPVTRTVRVAF
jgi:hypothetical protein